MGLTWNMIPKECLRKIKLVTDLDGTLVDDEDTICEETVTRIEELRKMGSSKADSMKSCNSILN